MSVRSSDSIVLTGLLKVRACCLFMWREWRDSPPEPGERLVEVGPEHCQACVEELERFNPPVRLVERAAMQEAARDLFALDRSTKDLAKTFISKRDRPV